MWFSQGILQSWLESDVKSDVRRNVATVGTVWQMVSSYQDWDDVTRHPSPRPATNLPASLAGNNLNGCPQCYESLVIVFTFTRTRAPSHLTFTCDAQTVSASSGWNRLLWQETVAFLPTL